MRLIPAIVLAILSVPASADPIDFRYCSGAELRMQMLEGETRIFRLLLRQGVEWVPYGRITLDGEGRSLSNRIDGEGATIFEPHNCEKIPGICQYTETSPDGTAVGKTRINGREGDVWSYSILETLDETFDVKVVGTVRYAEDGLVAEENWTETETYVKGCAIRQ